MGKREKLLTKVFGRPPKSDIKQKELESALKHLGFTEVKTGKSSGSRVRFALDADKSIQIRLHRSHGSDPVDKGALESAIRTVEDCGLWDSENDL